MSIMNQLERFEIYAATLKINIEPVYKNVVKSVKVDVRVWPKLIADDVLL
jgi:hypothetical protein